MQEEFQYMNPDEVKFEKEDDIEFLVIHPKIIDDLDYNDPGYLTAILNRVPFDSVKVKQSEFLVKVGEYLENDKYASEDTQIKKEIIHDEPNFLYEIIYLDIDDEKKLSGEIFNGLATLLNVKENHLFGNVILLKSHIPIDNLDSMSITSVDKKDIYNILDSRVNTKVVVYEDGEFREEVMNGEIDVYSKKIFDENFYLSEELPFLLHNLNIHYTHDEYGQEIMPSIVKGKIDIAVFFTMLSEDRRGNLTLDELKKILHLSNKLENYSVSDEQLKEEKDSMNRNIIKNKYRILEKLFLSNK